MKKILLLFSLSFSFLFVAGSVINSKKNKPQILVARVVMNIELLSGGESSYEVSCYNLGSVDCPGKGIKVEYMYY